MKKGLVLDGGGVFGIGQAQILSQVDVSKFDFFVGTSIGSAICAGIAAGEDHTTLPDFFHQEMPRIFKSNVCHKYNIFNPKYPDVCLNHALVSLLDGLTMGDVKKPLFITSANLSTNQLKVFKSTDSSDEVWPLWEVVRSATAAETYFAPWKGYADGGVFANNPSMVAIASACKNLQMDIGDIQLCSIGTGVGAGNYSPKKDFSLFTWGAWLLKTLLQGSSNSMHGYFARSMPIDKYVRIQFVRQKGWDMDNPKDMLKAEEAWEADIQKGIQTVNEFLEN
jgi:patatin-like phospholipase/acyl hydrolase